MAERRNVRVDVPQEVRRQLIRRPSGSRERSGQVATRTRIASPPSLAGRTVTPSPFSWISTIRQARMLSGHSTWTGQFRLS